MSPCGAVRSSCFNNLTLLFFVAASFHLSHLVRVACRALASSFLFVGHFVCHVQPFSIAVTVTYYLLGLAMGSMYATGGMAKLP